MAYWRSLVRLFSASVIAEIVQLLIRLVIPHFGKKRFSAVEEDEFVMIECIAP